MFQSKDKKKQFGSAYVAKRYDSMHGAEESPEHEEKESPEFEKGEQEGMNEAPETNEEHKQVVAEHKPAHTVIVKHDHKAGKHTVTSHHRDGHSHQSEHSAPRNAHEAAAILGGAGVDESEIPSEGGETAPSQGLPKLA